MVKRARKGTDGAGRTGKKGNGTRADTGFVSCPRCDTDVKEKNLEVHLRKVHGLTMRASKEEVRRVLDRAGAEKGGGALWPIVIVVTVVVIALIIYLVFLRPPDDGGSDLDDKDFQEVDLRTDDGWVLHGDLYEPQYGKPTIILVHGMNEDRRAYKELAEDLHDRGYGVLAYDIRAHGQSKVKDGKFVTVLTREDAQNMPLDIKAAMDLLEKKDALRDGVTLVGASVGANAAAVYTLDDDRIENLVLLSPGDDYQGLRPMDAVKAYDGAVLFVAATGDDIAYESCERFMDNATMARAKDLEYMNNSIYHGTGLLRDAGMYSAVVDWIVRYS